MSDVMLTPSHLVLRDEARNFTREEVPRQLLLDMDDEKVHYPRENIQKLAARHLLGIRFPQEFGRRGLDWSHEVLALEEIGVLGSSLACLFSLPSIVGEAIHVIGSREQKERYLKPILEGRMTVAEALTEPRGGSDFFDVTATTSRAGNYYILNGQKRFIVGAEGADLFLVYARTDTDASSHKAISAFLVERGEGVNIQHVYGWMGTRGGGTGRMYFRDVHAPVENMIGEEHGAYEFFNPPYGTLLKLEIKGMKNSSSKSVEMLISHKDGYALTAIPVAACLMQYLDGNIRKPGLWFQAHIVELKRFFNEMERMGAEVQIVEKSL